MQIFACSLRLPPDSFPNPALSTLAAILRFFRLSLYLCPPWFQYNLISPSERGHRSITRGSSPARLVLACIGVAASSLLSCAFVGHWTAESATRALQSRHTLGLGKKKLGFEISFAAAPYSLWTKPGFDDAEALAPRASLARPSEKPHMNSRSSYCLE